MTIIDKIKKSVEGATALDFLYHAAGEMNELIARAERLPVAFAFLIDSGTIDDVNGRYHERVTLAVMFCDKTEFDFNALENEQIIDRMKVKAYKWMQSLRMSNALHVVSVNNTQRLYDNTTDVLTGYAVNITLQDMYGVGECELPEVVIDVDKNGSYDVVGVDKVRVNVVPKLEELEVTQNGEYLPPTDIAGFSKVNVDVDVQPALEELTITANGTYTPQEGVDGFSKVVAEFDTSSLPKVKVSQFKVTDACINEDGIWEGDKHIDTSLITNLSYSFEGCTALQNLYANDWDTSKATTMNSMFKGCRGITNLDISNWNVSNVMYMEDVFSSCVILQVCNITNWDVSNATRLNGMFFNCSKLTSLIGGLLIDEVISNDVKCLKGLKVSANMFTYSSNIDRASLRALINGLADLTGQTTQTLTLGATLRAKLTEEDIAIATNKNWTIV